MRSPLRALLLALALLGAAPRATLAQAVGPPRPTSGPTYVLIGPYLYVRYPGGWTDVYMPVGGQWAWIDRIWWPSF